MPAGSRVRIAVMPAPASDAAANSSVTGPVPATAPGASTWTWAAAVPVPAANRKAPSRTEVVVRRAAGQRLVTVQWSSSGRAWFPSRTVAGASPSVPLPGRANPFRLLGTAPRSETPFTELALPMVLTVGRLRRRTGGHRARRGASVVAPVAWFPCAGLAVTLALALLTGVLARRAGLEQGTRSFENLARVTAATLTPALDGDPGLPPDPTADLRTHVDALVAAGPVVAVRVRSSSGQVLWADDRSVVGRTDALPDDARRALRTASVASLAADPGDPGVVAGRSSGRVLVAWVGVEDVHGTPLLVEFHESYTEVTDLAQRTWLRFAPAALGALALLQVLQVPLAWRLASKLRRPRQSEDALLQAAVDASDAERRRIAGEVHDHTVQDLTALAFRSEERRVGKECRSRWSPYH